MDLRFLKKLEKLITNTISDAQSYLVRLYNGSLTEIPIHNDLTQTSIIHNSMNSFYRKTNPKLYNEKSDN